jgi:hypothetical protein
MKAKERRSTYRMLTCGNPGCREEFLAELTMETLPTAPKPAPTHENALFPISCPTCESGSEHPGMPGVKTRFVRHLRPK